MFSANSNLQKKFAVRAEEEKKNDIIRTRKEIMSEITQTLIVYEHIKQSIKVIIRTSIFSTITEHDFDIVSILTHNDNINNLCLKLTAIYKLFHPNDERGHMVLKILVKKLKVLAATRNHLAHSRSIFIAIDRFSLEHSEDLDTIHISKHTLNESGYKKVRKKVQIHDLQELNRNVFLLSSAFDAFIFTLNRKTQDRDKIFDEELRLESLETIKMEI